MESFHSFAGNIAFSGHFLTSLSHGAVNPERAVDDERGSG
jgi:hypothetical protein